MGTWNSPPQIEAFQMPPYGTSTEFVQKALIEYMDELANVISALKNDLEFMINGNLDVKNIRAKSISADRMDVDELSAITANLGHIVSGLIESVQIFGSYIATRNGTFPRIEFNSDGNFLRALQSPTVYTELVTGVLGAPAFRFSDGVTDAVIMTLAFFGGALGITSNQDIILQPGTGKNVTVPSWSQLRSVSEGQSLASALAAKANAFSGASGSVVVGPNTLIFSNGILVGIA